MAVSLSAEKPLEERIDRSGRTLARRRIPYAARRKKRHSRGINDLYPCSEPRGWRRGKSAG